MISTSSITTSPDSSKNVFYITSIGKVSQQFIRKTNYLIGIATSTSKNNLELSLKVAKDLIAKGHMVDQPNESGKTPLYYAAKFTQMEIAKLYLDKGADPNVQDLEGMTPFHIACCCASLDMIKLLFEEGAFLFQPDNQGDTPMHWAVREGQEPDVIQYLVDQDPTIILAKNHDGETPFDFAKEFGEEEMIKIFQKTFQILEKNAEKDPLLDKSVQEYKNSTESQKSLVDVVPNSPVLAQMGTTV